MSELNIKKKGPFPAYEGDEPYIFISYKHDDSDVIYPILKEFHDAGVNIWYDDGLEYGEDYDDKIDMKIDGASLFVICITERVIKFAYDSDEYMKKELDVALDVGVKIFPIFIDDVKLKGKYRMQLKGKHSIFRNQYVHDDFIKECLSAFENEFGIEIKDPKEDLDKTVEASDKIVEGLNGKVGASEKIVEGLDNKVEGLDKKLEDLAIEDNIDGLDSSSESLEIDPYIFASYANIDRNIVLKELEKIEDLGYDIRYDKPDNIGFDNIEEINKCIINSSLFIVFLTDNSIESRTVVSQIYLAVENDIPIVPIYLTPADLSKLPGSLHFKLSRMQSIFKNRMNEGEYVHYLVKTFKEYGFDRLEGDVSFSQNPLAYISYSTKDIAIANNVCKVLEDNDLKCWIAPRDINPGLNYSDEIMNGIASSKILVCILSKSSQQSHFVLNEIDMAVSRKKPILVYKIDESSLDGMEFILMGAQFIDASSSLKYDDLVENVKLLSLSTLHDSANNENNGFSNVEDASDSKGKFSKFLKRLK